jgi:hypothetical protein
LEKRIWFQRAARMGVNGSVKRNTQRGEARRNRCSRFTRGRSLVRSQVRPWLQKRSSYDDRAAESFIGKFDWQVQVQRARDDRPGRTQEVAGSSPASSIAELQTQIPIDVPPVPNSPALDASPEDPLDYFGVALNLGRSRQEVGVVESGSQDARARPRRSVCAMSVIMNRA